MGVCASTELVVGMIGGASDVDTDEDEPGCIYGPHFWLQENDEDHHAMGKHVRLHVMHDCGSGSRIDHGAAMAALSSGVSRLLDHGRAQVPTYMPLSVGIDGGINGGGALVLMTLMAANGGLEPCTMASCSLRVVHWSDRSHADEINGIGIMCEGQAVRYSASFFPLNSLILIPTEPGFNFLQAEFEIAERCSHARMCNRPVYPIATRMTTRGFCSMIAAKYALPSIRAKTGRDVAGCALAVLMACHPRLGARSPLGPLDASVLTLIARECLPLVIGEAVDAGLVRL